mmetsp:Transcript_52351/g.113451  ORF Transcript_52351/g.113451 Transcript_52351/m.113451 type:complete len:473 (-) Transcript_52351:172-1590(-)
MAAVWQAAPWAHIVALQALLSAVAVWPAATLPSTAAVSTSAATTAATEPAAVTRSVLLQKQYVPIMKNGEIIAYKSSYFGTIHAGSPQSQPFSVVFDTGSGQIILPSTACDSPTCRKHRRFDRAASSSAVDIEDDGTPIPPGITERDQVVIAFGTGQVRGDFVKESVCLGAEQEDCIMVRTVLAEEMTADPFGLFAFDGVLGLGLNSLALNPHFSFLTQVAKQHAAMKPQFAFYLARNDDGESSITFGGYDPKKAASEMIWTPVVREALGYWQVQIKGIGIGDSVLEECEDGSCYAILDTGTSLLGVPRQLTRTMHRSLARTVQADSSASASDIDCRTVPGAEIRFDLGGHVVSLGVEDYSRPMPFNMTIPGKDQWKLICRSLLLPLDMEAPVGPKVFIWGEPVLRRYYTVYDPVKKQIGFSVAAEATSPGLPAVGAPPPNSQVSGSPLPPRSSVSLSTGGDVTGSSVATDT